MVDLPFSYYLSLPYPLEIIPDREEGGWVIKIKELRGCPTQTDDWDAIPDLVEVAKRLWLESALEHGDPIPQPVGVVS